MCTNGVNTGQLEMMIDQIDDHIKLERRHAHDLGHLASDAGFATVGEKLHDVMRLLDAAKIPYRAAEYEVDENDLNGMHAAEGIGMPPERAWDCLLPGLAEAEKRRAIEQVGTGMLARIEDGGAQLYPGVPEALSTLKKPGRLNEPPQIVRTAQKST